MTQQQQTWRYVVYRADLSGTEDEVAWHLTPTAALCERDERRERFNSRTTHYRVLDEDDPERGSLEWDG